MRSGRYLSPDQLPPKPDPLTGLPRPPHAPRYAKREQDPKLDRNRETDPAKAPAAPDGQGPVLAWYRQSRRDRTLNAFWTSVILVVCFSIGIGFSFEWMAYWWMWLVVLIGVILVDWSLRGCMPAAGADWLQQRGRVWVRTYELVKVTAHSRPTGLDLKMTDRDGRSCFAMMNDLQRDRLIWDLVYNGILHSVVAGGAETNGALHSALDVPYPDPYWKPAGQ